MADVGAENHILFIETGFTGSSRYFFAFPQNAGVKSTEMGDAGEILTFAGKQGDVGSKIT